MKTILRSAVFAFILLVAFGQTDRALAQCNIITTAAGTGSASYGGDGGAATAARLYYPHGLWIDASGNVLIADQQNNAIRKINPSGIISTVAGTGSAGFSGDGGAATSAMINKPYAVICDPAGNIYFSDYTNQRIRKVSTSGIITTIAGNGTASSTGDGGPATAANIISPCGLAIDPTGNIYFAQETRGTVRKISSTGIISTYAGLGGGGGIGDGGPASSATFNNPNYVHADTMGNLYISDNGNHRVRKVNSSGIISTFAGNSSPSYAGDGGAATSAHLGYPAGINIDASGNVYIADSYNSRIRKVDASGIISTVAGSGSASFSGDGGAATAAGMAPNDIVFDISGNIYIADYYNNRVRKVSSGVPTVSPIAGGTTVSVGSFITLTDATSGGTWTTSSASIASVNSTTGVVYGVAYGTATISYSVTNSCGATVVTKPITVTSTLLLSNTTTTHPSITLYPNPTNNNVTITASNLTGNIVSIKCYSLIGALVLDKTATVTNGEASTSIDLNHLQSGIYEVVVRNEAGQRFVRSVVRE